MNLFSLMLLAGDRLNNYERYHDNCFVKLTVQSSKS